MDIILIINLLRNTAGKDWRKNPVEKRREERKREEEKRREERRGERKGGKTGRRKEA